MARPMPPTITVVDRAGGAHLRDRRRASLAAGVARSRMIDASVNTISVPSGSETETDRACLSVEFARVARSSPGGRKL